MNKQLTFICCLMILVSCEQVSSPITQSSLDSIKLKRGEVVVCGPGTMQFGNVGFELTGSDSIKKDFNLALSLLHSFEYDESEKVFAKIIYKDPQFPMAYWGVAMSNFHQVWPTQPTKEELEKGSRAIRIAKELEKKTKREADYIDAIGKFYEDWAGKDHRSRVLNYEKAMAQLYNDYPNDKEAAIFYALALDGSAVPTDKTYANQKKAGEILTALYNREPSHPGIVHYIIHSYDYPELAELALPAARKYASIAPSSAHAQHMPSHIFTRLGLWEEAIKSNIASIDAAKCYAEGSGIKGHWDEELHGLDYLMYAYLQKGQMKKAKEQLDYLKSIDKVTPQNFKVAYAYAAIPARYYLENKMWKDAAAMELYPTDFPWEKFPWQKAIYHNARMFGNIHLGNIEAAETELKELNTLRQSLLDQKDSYKANQVDIQIKSGEAWIQLKKGNNAKAIELMKLAADMEDKTEKSSVTPGEVIPASELLGDLLISLNKFDEALTAYEIDLRKHPNRFNGLYGAGYAAEKSKDFRKAKAYYWLFVKSAEEDPNREEFRNANYFLARSKQ